MSIRNNFIYAEESRFGQIRIVDTFRDGKPVRCLLVDGWQESSLYREPYDADMLVFPYMRKMSRLLSLRPAAEKVFLIGGGGFAWPRNILRWHPELSVTVTELYPEMVRIAEDFFGLDEVEERYGKRLRVEVGDGFEILKEEGEVSSGQRHVSQTAGGARYDFIVNDAFVGNKSTGRTLQDIRLVRSHLTEDGVYMVNVISAVKGLSSVPLKRFLFLLGRVFRYRDFLVCEPDRSPYDPQNLIVVASDAPVMWGEFGV